VQSLYSSAYAWKREGRAIITDDPGPINVVYTAAIAYEEASPLLAAAAGHNLAILIARRVSDGDALRARLKSELRETLSMAAGATGNEHSVDPSRTSTVGAYADIEGFDDVASAVARSR